VFKQDTKNLILVEFADEVDLCIKILGDEFLKQPENYIVAFEPRAQTKLRRLGITYGNTFTFFGRKGHENCLRQTERIIRKVRESICITDELDVNEGYTNTLILYLRLLLHECLFLAEVIDTAVNTLKPTSIIYPRPAARFHDLMLSESDRLLGEVARQYCEKAGIKSKQLGQARGFQKTGRLMKEAKRLGIRLVFPLLLTGYSRGFKDKLPILIPVQSHGLPAFVSKIHEMYPSSFLVFLEAKKNILHDVRDILFKRDFWCFFSLPTHTASKDKKKFDLVVQRNVRKIEDIFETEHDLLKYRGIDLRPILKLYLERAVVPGLLDLYGKTKSLNKILETRKPALVISQNSAGIGCNLGELCRKYGVPSLLISHGSHVPPKNEFESIEWGDHGLGLMNTPYEYLALQTPWAAGYLEHFPTESKTLVTGPLIFARRANALKSKTELRNQILPGVKAKWVILHAGTPKRRGSRRFYVYETDDEYVENINSLIRAVEKLKDTYLVVRFRPEPRFDVEDLMTLLVESDCYGIHPEGSFEDFMLMADLLVSYSSTTIEEALQNRIPVLQYDPQGKYCHVPCNNILGRDTPPHPDACYFVGAEHELFYGLSWIIENYLSKNGLPESTWERHIFADDQIKNVVEHFGYLFQD